MKFTIIFFTLYSFLGFSQEKDYYQLFKDGKMYPKSERYINLTDSLSYSVNEEKDKIIFNMNSETFIHFREGYDVKKLSKEHLKNLSMISMSELREEERLLLEENRKEVLEEYGHNVAPPLNHIFFKTFMVMKKTDSSYIAYEVLWKYSIN